MVVFAAPRVIAQPDWIISLESDVHLNAVDFVDENVGFAGGYGVVLRTLDGGETWTNILPAFLFSSDQTAIKALSPDTVFTLGTPSSTLRFTFDGGETWGTNVLERTFGQFTWITALDALAGGPIFAVGQSANNPRILRSVNGSDWFAMNHGIPVGLFVDVEVVDKNTVWAVGLDNHIVRSDDGGLTWEARDSPVDAEDGTLVEFTKVHFLEGGTVGWIATGLFAGGGNAAPATIFRTTDAGESWEEMSTLPSVARPGITGLTFTSPDMGWIAYGKVVASTSDGGRTWEEIGTPSMGRATTTNLDFVDDDHGWVVGGRGARSGSGFIFRTDGGSSVSTTEELPDVISSLAVYPNPIKGSSAEITFMLERSDKVLIEVYDVLGRLVDRMMEGVAAPGTNRLVWRPKDIRPGSYLISMRGGGSVLTTSVVVLN